jgi:HD-GYP domain-containing protein (c-di-GMP phosphodiesterase class II)
VAADPQGGEPVRTAELIGALCLATDLGMAFPFEHGLQTTLVAMRLADRLEVERGTAELTYYAALLSHAGCTTAAHIAAEVFGGSLTTALHPVMYGSAREVMTGLLRALPDPGSAPLARMAQTARRLPRMARAQRPALASSCEVAGMLADRVGAPDGVSGLLAHLTDRWDGKGPLGHAAGEQIPLPMRIVHVAIDACFQTAIGGAEHALRVIGERAGRAFDPAVTACLARSGPALLAAPAGASAWSDVLACEPPPARVLAGGELERGLAAMASFADLISPYLTRHSQGVAELAAGAAGRCGLDAARATAIRRAALLHDLGRVGVTPRIWQKPGALTAAEWEQVRMHPYLTGRVLSRSRFFAALSPAAAAHHERLDGSGYHRGAAGPELGLPERLVAAADAYHAMIEPRPHREPLTPDRAARALADEVGAGRLDADAAGAVIAAAGATPPALERPAGLTDREAEVVALLARGLQTKQVAGALGIAVKTADRHVQNAYRKLGVSSRAAATLRAMELGLIAWGDLPIVRAGPRS